MPYQGKLSSYTGLPKVTVFVNEPIKRKYLTLLDFADEYNPEKASELFIKYSFIEYKTQWLLRPEQTVEEMLIPFIHGFLTHQFNEYRSLYHRLPWRLDSFEFDTEKSDYGSILVNLKGRYIWFGIIETFSCSVRCQFYNLSERLESIQSQAEYRLNQISRNLFNT